ncbi:MAG: phosphoribosylaminoimidazolesuccinocarboxamide synthase [Deferribacteres bacterium]|nr:phosphoribosylaminoimidazolesuccinocarboxamide synthase [candidate division KSB1 bacterium]MCB9502422.1 phosphoribosylaminoimidazolesuccinocarboxamide synthase [Deferribacteres bacterium]
MKTSTLFESTIKDIPLSRRGKVRDVYQPNNESLLIVACDRISAFDYVLPTPVPGKGQLLTQMSNFWFKKTKHIILNHIIDDNPGPVHFPDLDWYSDELEGRTVLVKSAKPLAIEAIVRGYITGSGWKEYKKGCTVCGISLPVGLQESEKLSQPIFTPSTKANSGHDENITFEQAANIIGSKLADHVRDVSIALYKFAADYALERGIIIADTKFEFGVLGNGDLILIDEALTPDSSRFWDTETYEAGRSQDSYDKQYVRDYLESIKWNKQPPVPALPENVVANTVKKYQQALMRLTK